MIMCHMNFGLSDIRNTNENSKELPSFYLLEWQNFNHSIIYIMKSGKDVSGTMFLETIE